jgi:hypothetical protein
MCLVVFRFVGVEALLGREDVHSGHESKQLACQIAGLFHQAEFRGFYPDRAGA